MSLIMSNNSILRTGNGGTVEYDGQYPVQVDNDIHRISLDSGFSSQFASSAVEGTVNDLTACCQEVQEEINGLSGAVDDIEGNLVYINSNIGTLSGSVNYISAQMPDLTNYATQQWVLERDYLTNSLAAVTYQPIGDYERAGTISSVSSILQNEISSTSSHLESQLIELSSTVASANNYTLSAGPYIKLTDNSANLTTEISVTGLPDFSEYASTAYVDNVLSGINGKKVLVTSADTYVNVKAILDAGDFPVYKDELNYYELTHLLKNNETSAGVTYDSYVFASLPTSWAFDDGKGQFGVKFVSLGINTGWEETYDQSIMDAYTISSTFLKKSDYVSSFSALSSSISSVSSVANTLYSGTYPIVVDNYNISADTIELSAGEGISQASLETGVIEVTGISAATANCLLSAENYTDTLLSGKIVYEDLGSVTFNTVDSTLWHKGVMVPSMNVSAGAKRYFQYESSALIDSTTAYNFVAVEGYDIYKATISASGSQGFTTLTGYTSSYCPPQIAIVSTSSQIPASGSSDNRVWIVTGV